MTNSTKRAIKTGIQAVFGVLAGLAVVLPLLGAGLGIASLAAAGGTVVAVSAGASKIWNVAVASGKLPAWLADSHPLQTATKVTLALTPDQHDH